MCVFFSTYIFFFQVESSLNMEVIDSLNFFPMALAKLPKTFGLEGAKKGDFPHFFNIATNYGYVGPYPHISCYGMDIKSTEDRKTFMAWYDTKKDEVFDFEKELLDYCRNDVRILAESCLKFRQLLLDIGGIDPFNYISIASTCMAVFKNNFLEEEYEVVTLEEHKSAEREKRPAHPIIISVKGALPMETQSKKFLRSKLGIVPATGYTVRNNYSHQSILWLEWLVHQNPGLTIQHALNGGEFKIPHTNYRVDGYNRESKTVYEFLGCLWHGCPTCYPQRDMVLPRSNETADVLFFHTQERLQHLRHSGYKVETIWEHEFKDTPCLEEFAKTVDVQPRLNIRDAFFGGK